MKANPQQKNNEDEMVVVNEIREKEDVENREGKKSRGAEKGGLVYLPESELWVRDHCSSHTWVRAVVNLQQLSSQKTVFPFGLPCERCERRDGERGGRESGAGAGE